MFTTGVSLHISVARLKRIKKSYITTASLLAYLNFLAFLKTMKRTLTYKYKTTHVHLVSLYILALL